MKQRRPLIVGNWKMNGDSVANASLLTELLSGVGRLDPMQCAVAVCAPFPYLGQAQSALHMSSVKWGAQDVSSHINGAYTGDVSATMLKDFSCTFAIVGHSERRFFNAETDTVVGQKALRLIASGITPVVCVGETFQERKDNLTETVVSRQLDSVLSVLDQSVLDKIVVAYEPVWAIGTGVTATPEMAQDVHAFLRCQLRQVNAESAEKVSILYGGSMKPENAATLLAMNDIDGGLIGGASLKSADFLEIIAIANSL